MKTAATLVALATSIHGLRPALPQRATRSTRAAPRMAISALLFDCDGVIADTEPDGHRPAFNAAFKEKGFSDVWTKEHYGELLETGGGKERMTAHWNTVGWPAGYEDAEKQQELVKELHLRKTAIFNEMITKGEIPIRKGVLISLMRPWPTASRLVCVLPRPSRPSRTWSGC